MKYLAGKRIQGSPAERQPTFQDDFSSDGFTDQGSGINVASGKLTGVFTRSGTNDSSWRDIGLLNNEKFVIRFKLDITTYSGGTGGSAQFANIGVSDTNGATGSQSSRDGLGIGITRDGAQPFNVLLPDGAIWSNGQTAMTTNASQTAWYVEWIRLSATSFTVNLYSDSAFTTLVESKNVTISSGITSLRYFMAQNINDGGSSSYLITASIDDLQVFNNVTSVPNITFDSGSIFEDTVTNKHYIFGTGNTPWTEVS